MSGEQRPGMDPRTESVVGEWLSDGPDRLPDHVLQDVLQQTSATPQARRRFLGRWLDRDEGTGRRATGSDHPPDHDRRTKLMFTTSGAIAVLAIAALAVNVIDTDPAPPDLVSGTTHVVAADGSGDFTTVAEAVAAAVEGDTVLLTPGTYAESVVIDSDITLRGDGDARAVVLTFEGPDPVLSLVGSDATVSGLTVTGADTQVLIDGGSPTLTGVRFDSIGQPYQGDFFESTWHYSLWLVGGSSASVADNEFVSSGPLMVDHGSAPDLRSNRLSAGAHIWLWDVADETAIVGNTIVDPLFAGIITYSSGSYLIEGNVIEGAPEYAIGANNASTGVDPRIVSNVIRDSRMAIQLPGGAAVISDNEFSGNETGVALTGAEATIEGNVFDAGDFGVVVSGGGAPTVEGNTIDVAQRGITVGANTPATIVGNDVCGGNASIFVWPNATATIDGNTTCEEAASG